MRACELLGHISGLVLRLDWLVLVVVLGLDWLVVLLAVLAPFFLILSLLLTVAALPVPALLLSAGTVVAAAAGAAAPPPVPPSLAVPLVARGVRGLRVRGVSGSGARVGPPVGPAPPPALPRGLHRQPVPEESPAVHLVHCVLCVVVVLELHERVRPLELDLPDFAILFENVAQFLGVHPLGVAPDIDLRVFVPHRHNIFYYECGY
jgi:hypothetical protein